MADHRDNLLGGGWLIADMALNIWALTIVKTLGLGYPAWQLVFLRAVVGFVIMLPWIWTKRTDFLKVQQLPLHALRVVFSALALTLSFFAIARLPFALFTTINFTRPFVTMIMAAVILHEAIPHRRWIAVALGFIGILIAVEPSGFTFTWGLPALFLTVIFGTSAIIVTRKLAKAPTHVMMTFYTAGLALLTLPFAAFSWTPVQPGHWLPLLAIGVFAQSAQLCFLRAHKRAEAGFLAILGYLSLVLSTSVGYFLFDEIPQRGFIIGAILIVGAALWSTTIKSKQKAA